MTEHDVGRLLRRDYQLELIVRALEEEMDAAAREWDEAKVRRDDALEERRRIRMRLP